MGRRYPLGRDEIDWHDPLHPLHGRQLISQAQAQRARCVDEQIHMKAICVTLDVGHGTGSEGPKAHHHGQTHHQSRGRQGCATQVTAHVGTAQQPFVPPWTDQGTQHPLQRPDQNGRKKSPPTQ